MFPNLFLLKFILTSLYKYNMKARLNIPNKLSGNNPEKIPKFVKLNVEDVDERFAN